MLEYLKHWFDSLKDGSHLFEHADDEALHAALASLLNHIIGSHGHVGTREKREFGKILMQEFDLDAQQVDHLYEAAKASSGDPEADLHTIAAHLKQNPALRMDFMRKLLQLIDVDGAERQELIVFYQVLRELFPELSELSRDYDPAWD